ncbi:MAG: polysaccharide deacetylase family protein [bacterium]
MKNIVCPIAVFLLFCSAPNPLTFAGNITLCYHQFDYSLHSLYSVLPEVFEWQLSYIQSKKIPFASLSDMMRRYSWLPQKEKTDVCITVDDGWRDFMNVTPILQQKRIPATLFLYPAVINKSKDYLNLDELSVLKKQKLVDFGCHSYTHALLKRKDEVFLKREIVDSKKELEKTLGRKMQAFAYPYGVTSEKAVALVKKQYKVAFKINPEPNNRKTDKYLINRYTVFKNTTFGEFKSYIDALDGSTTRETFAVESLGIVKDEKRGFQYARIRLHKYAPQKIMKTVLIMPNSSLGPGWAYKIIPMLIQENCEVYVMEYRSANIPFYRTDYTLALIQSWGLQTYVDDTTLLFDTLLKRRKKITVITWGDGFDIMTAVYKSDQKYKQFVERIIAVNPSILEKNQFGKTYAEQLAYYNKLISQKKHASPTFDSFLEVKTLCDLAILRPNDASPFAHKYKSDNITNEMLLERVFEQQDYPVLAIRRNVSEYSSQDFRDAFFQKLPLFSMIVPTVLRRDICKGFTRRYQVAVKGADSKLGLTADLLCSKTFNPNGIRIQTVLLDKKICNIHNLQNLSTIEILLSNKGNGIIRDIVKNAGISNK